ncbi:MAG: hypothetical protein MJ247_02715 [Alphaproteobacteria bacterium]|nr:hypothetical protein [Alphaproteobacteria bacterium]
MKAKKLVPSVIALALLAGCASNQPNGGNKGSLNDSNYADSQMPDASSQNSCKMVPEGGIVKFRAQNIKFITAYTAPSRRPNVDHELLVRPEQFLYQWAYNRFGVDKTPDRYVRFMIKDASIVENQTVTGGWSKSVNLEYSGKLDVVIQFVDAEGHRFDGGEIVESVQKKVVLPGEADYRDKESAWLNLTYDLLRMLSERLDNRLCGPAYDDLVVR